MNSILQLSSPIRIRTGQSANTDQKVRLIKAKGIVTAFLLRKQTVICNYQYDFIHDGNIQLLILYIIHVLPQLQGKVLF